MGKTVNRRRVMYAVTFSEHEVETPLEVLEAFITSSSNAMFAQLL